METRMDEVVTLDIPGFIDLQVNGFRGVDFSGPDLTAEEFRRACDELRCAGTAAFLPTMITSPLEVYRRNLPLMAALMDDPDLAGCALGFHLEGPFLSATEGARGIHDKRYIRTPDPALFDELMDLARGKIRLLTIGGDVEGATDLARHAVSRGVVVSLGHHLAGAADMRRLADAGARALTHLGNGVPVVLPRHDNPIMAGIAEDRLIGMIITDGHHLPPSVITAIVRGKGAGRLIVTTDASPVAGLPPGRYALPGLDVILEESGFLHDADSPYLAGSSATMLHCMNHLAGLGLLSLDELIAVGFHNPLRLIGLDPSAVRITTRLRYDGLNRRFSIDRG